MQEKPTHLDSGLADVHRDTFTHFEDLKVVQDLVKEVERARRLHDVRTGKRAQSI